MSDGLLCLVVSVGLSWCAAVHAAIPPAASADPLYALGYLVCDHYANVESNGTGDGTTDLNTCIIDAYNNQLAATLNVCGGVYLVSNSLLLYEWLGWNAATNATKSQPAQAHTLRGREGAGCARPTLKVKPGSTAFQDEANPRPVVAFRGFSALNSGAVVGTKPAHPLGMPANFEDGGRVDFENIFHNIDIDTSGEDGAIGVTNATGQGGSITNSKVTATGSYAGFFAPPGRSGLVANVEVIGGAYGLVIGKYANLGNIDPQQGTTIVGFKATGQTIAALRTKDSTPPTVVGFEITKSSNGPAILAEGGGIALIDGQVTMTSAAVNDVVVDNSVGMNVYARNMYVTGSNKIFQHGALISGPSGSGTWARVTEYAATDQTNLDGNTTASVYPPTPAPGPTRFEARSVINGQLSGGPLAIEQITWTTQAPPSDLLARHLWSTPLPSVWDSPQCIVPTTTTPPYIGLDYDAIMTNTYNAATAINTAITDAAAAGHNRVCLPRGTLLIGSKLTWNANTKFIGAGPRKTSIATISSWNPGTPQPMIETANSATGTAYGGFFTLWFKVRPLSTDFLYPLRWRTGKNSSLLVVDLSSQFICECGGSCTEANKLRYAFWLTDAGGGRFWMTQHYLPTNVDRHFDSRLVFLDGNTQPASFYANNLEAGKASACGMPYSNMEVKNNTAGVRSYGTKREGKSGTVYINSSSNVGVFGTGAMAAGLTAASQAFNVVTSSSDNYVIGPVTVRNNTNTTKEPIFMIAPATEHVPWPNGVSVVKKGTLNDSPFGAVASSAPDLSAIIVDTADRVDIKFNVYDGAALLPAPPTGATGFTFTVDGTAKTPNSAIQRVGTDTYRAPFTVGTITNNTQPVRVTYTPGNVTAGGAGTPAALAFSDVLASNTLPPGSNPVWTQTAFMFRQISGGMDLASSPPYTTTGGIVENGPGRFLLNSEFRVQLKASVNNAAAPTQALTICWEQNESGAFALLTNDCTVNKTCFTDAPDLADGAPTLEQLTPTEGTFVPGGLLEQQNTQVNVTLPQDSETAYEAAIRISGATVGHRYRYRLCKAGGAPLDSYPAATVALVTIISQRAELNGGMAK